MDPALQDIITRIESARRACQDWCDHKGNANDLIECAKNHLNRALGDLELLKDGEVKLPPLDCWGGIDEKSPAQVVTVDYQDTFINLTLGENVVSIERHTQAEGDPSTEFWWVGIARKDSDVLYLRLYPEHLEVYDGCQNEMGIL